MSKKRNISTPSFISTDMQNLDEMIRIDKQIRLMDQLYHNPPPPENIGEDNKEYTKDGRDVLRGPAMMDLGGFDPIYNRANESKYDTGYTPGAPGGRMPIRAKNQGWVSEVANTLVEPILNAPFMLGQYVTAATLPSDFDDVEDTTRYQWYKWFKDNADDVRETFPVYQGNPSGFASAREYILSTGQQVGESAMPFLAIGAGVSAATGAALGIAGNMIRPFAGKFVQAALSTKQGVDKFNYLKSVVNTANAVKSGANVANTLGTAYMLNRTESMVEAADNYGQILDMEFYKLKQKRETDLGRTLTFQEDQDIREEAKETAAIGASATEQFNRVNMLLNITSAARFLKPISRSRRAFVPKTNSDIFRAIGVETLQESAEETINLLAQTYGKAIASGNRHEGIFDYLFSREAMSEVLTSDGAHSAFAGALGGALQTGLTESISRKTQSYKKAYENWRKTVDELDSYAKDHGKIKLSTLFGDIVQKSKLFHDYNKLVEEALEQQKKTGKLDDSKIRPLENMILQLQALNAFERGAGAELQGIYESLRDMDPAEAEKLGYDSDPESYFYYKDKANDALESIAELEAEYNFSTDFANKNGIYFNRAINHFIRKEIGENENILSMFSGVTEERISQIFGKTAYNLEDVFTDMQNVIKSENATKENPVEISERMQNDLEYASKVMKFMNSVEGSSFYKHKNYGNQLSDWLKNNNDKYDELLSPKKQEEFKKKEEDSEKNRQEELRKIAEEQERREEEAELNRKREENQIKTLTELGYSDVEIKAMDDATRTNTIKNKIKKDELPIVLGRAETEEELRSKEEAEKKRLAEEKKRKEEEKKKLKEAEDLKKKEAEEKRLKEEEEKRAKEESGEEQEGEEEQDPEDGIDKTPPTPAEIEDLARKMYDGNLPDGLSPREQWVRDNHKDSLKLAMDKIMSEKGHDEETKTNLPAEDSVPGTVQEEEMEELFKSLAQGNVDPNLVLDESHPRIEQAHDKIAHRSRDFEVVETPLPDGSTQTQRKETTDKINPNTFLDLMHPDKFGQDTPITMRVHDSYNGEILDPKNPKKYVKWSELKKGLDPKSDQYLDVVPVAIYSGNTIIGYLHDITWIQQEQNNRSFNDPQDSKNLRNIRYTVINNGEFNTIIIDKGKGRFFVAKDKKKASVSERFPGAPLAVQTPGGLKGFAQGTVVQNEPRMGRLTVLAETANGLFYAVPVDTKRLSDPKYKMNTVIATTVLNYLIESEGFKQSFEESGFPMNSFADLADYVSHFVYSYNFESEAKDFKTYVRKVSKDNNLPSNKYFFNFTGNAVEFGNSSMMYFIYKNAEGKTVVRKEGTLSGSKVQNEFTSSDIKNGTASLLMEALRTMAIALGETNIRPSARKMGGNIVVPRLNAQGLMDGVAFQGKYMDFLAENSDTALMTVNVGTDQKPRRVATIQPTITFDTEGVIAKPEGAFKVVQPDSSTVADIRKAELDKEVNAVKNAKTKEELIKSSEQLIGINPYDAGAVSMGTRAALMTPGSFDKGKQLFLEEIKGAITAKYDAELAALEKADEEVTPIPEPPAETKPKGKTLRSTRKRPPKPGDNTGMNSMNPLSGLDLKTMGNPNYITGFIQSQLPLSDQSTFFSKTGQQISDFVKQQMLTDPSLSGEDIMGMVKKVICG